MRRHGKGVGAVGLLRKGDYCACIAGAVCFYCAGGIFVTGCRSNAKRYLCTHGGLRVWACYYCSIYCRYYYGVWLHLKCCGNGNIINGHGNGTVYYRHSSAWVAGFVCGKGTGYHAVTRGGYYRKRYGNTHRHKTHGRKCMPSIGKNSSGANGLA